MLIGVALLIAFGLPPSVELAVWAVLRGVPVEVALAVHEVETGAVPEARRDTVISAGNVGRLQVNATTWWGALGYRSRDEAVEVLQDRHANFAAGTAILARFEARYSLGRSSGCRCGSDHMGGWVAHYNGGTVVLPGSVAERYGLEIRRNIHRIQRSQERDREAGPAQKGRGPRTEAVECARR